MIEKNIERIADALEALVRLAGEGSIGAVATEAPKKRTKKETVTADPLADLGAPDVSAADKAPVAPASAGKPTSYEDVVDMLRQLVTKGDTPEAKKKSTEKAKAILTKYKADRVSALAESDYAKVYAEMDAELKK